MSTPFDITPYLGLSEGQHFDRKSLFEGPPDQKRPRNRRTVRDEIAEYVAGFANAEGGVLVLGLEDDGRVTGHGYPEDAIIEMLRVPTARLQPPMPEGMRIAHEGKELLVFDVPAADTTVMVTGNGYPLRVGDTTVKMEEPKIRALKLEGLAESWVNRPSSVGLAELDAELLARSKAGAGYPDISDQEFLLRRKLADRRGTGLVLRRAAELLFAREPDHPNAGVRIFRVIGTERSVGVDYNVEELPRVEGPIPRVLTRVFELLPSLLRTPSRLRGSRFTPTPEYPEFAWKEAILNAIAHRDYGNQGRSVEVTLFEDRMEVTSPGGLLPEISLDALRTRLRVHQSRNPRLVRPLVDLGFMRDQGEGLPRLFAEMEGMFLPEPELASTSYGFSLTLRNTPTLTDADRAFIGRLDSEELTALELRALLESSRHGRVDNARMRRIAGLDTLGASKLLRVLRDRGLLVLHAAGASSYFELSERLRGAGVGAGGPVTSEGSSRQLEIELPSVGPTAPVSSAAKPGRAAKLREQIRAFCSTDWKTPAEIARALSIRSPENLTRRHLGPMVEAKELRRRYEERNHPAQAYRAVDGATP